MGLFFNYDKPGKGVEKDAPKKKGFFLYFELVWRKLGKIFLSNMLYFLVSLPVIAVYYFFYLNVIVGNVVGITDGTALHQLILICTVLTVVLWGTGPVSAGYTFILRNFAREEHVWLLSDFFGKCKENFKHCIVFLIVDFAALFFGLNAIFFYGSMAKDGNTICLLFMVITVFCMAVYTFMHFYMYQFAVTFENGIKDLYKNSLMMALATMPMNLLLSAVVFVLTYFAFSILTPVAIGLLVLLCWIGFMRFPIDFYSARIIKKRLIANRGNGEEAE